MVKHPQLTSNRWFKLSLAEQLGNVGSEYERTLKRQQNKDLDRFNSAFKRFLELLDLTIADPRWSLFRKREMLRLREATCAEFLDGPKGPDFKKYFYNFALLARRDK